MNVDEMLRAVSDSGESKARDHRNLQPQQYLTNPLQATGKADSLGETRVRLRGKEVWRLTGEGQGLCGHQGLTGAESRSGPRQMHSSAPVPQDLAAAQRCRTAQPWGRKGVHFLVCRSRYTAWTSPSTSLSLQLSHQHNGNDEPDFMGCGKG